MQQRDIVIKKILLHTSRDSEYMYTASFSCYSKGITVAFFAYVCKWPQRKRHNNHAHSIYHKSGVALNTLTYKGMHVRQLIMYISFLYGIFYSLGRRFCYYELLKERWNRHYVLFTIFTCRYFLGIYTQCTCLYITLLYLLSYLYSRPKYFPSSETISSNKESLVHFVRNDTAIAQSKG